MNILRKLLAKSAELSKITDSGWRRKRIHHRINGPIQHALHGSGIDYANADWDTLIILDACRADLFEESVDTDRWDSYKRGNSGAGATPTWFKRKWSEEYGDIVYVAGTPILSRRAPGSFHRVIECWQNAINENLNGPDPKIVTESAIEAHKRYPNKRVVVHYMQPHYPFLCDPELHFTEFSGTKEWDVNADPRAGNVWEALRAGIVTKNQVWGGYKRNLEYVIEEVDDLLEEIDGKVVVSADHGNMMGEWTYPIPFREYGHPMHLNQPSLTSVPWAVDDGQRRKIIQGDVQSSTNATPQEIETQLKALGYQ